jgi:cysteine desulfurase
MPRTIYFDYNATTPLDPAVRDAMLPFFDVSWGNPSSVHHLGRRARATLDDLRDCAAGVLVAKPSELIFTSGGTESNNLAVLGTARHLKTKGKHLITSRVEHHSVLNCFDYLEKNEGFAVSRLPVDSEGRFSPEALKEAIRPDTILVSLMAANNEIGTLQPVAECGAICRERGVVFHTDAVQWFGKEPFEKIGQFNADLVSLCAHKFHGPKGIGLLYCRSSVRPAPLFLGGSQENELRAGTENLPAVAGLVKAMRLFLNPPVFDRSKLAPLAAKLFKTIEAIDGVKMASPRQLRLANTVSFVVIGTDSIALLAGLDLEGVCASGGAACSAGSLEPSLVISAVGMPELANSLVRFSLGRDTTGEEVDFVADRIESIIRCAQLGN